MLQVTYMQLNKQLVELQHMFFGNARRLDKALQDNDIEEFRSSLHKNILLGLDDPAAVDSLFTYVMQVGFLIIKKC